MGSYLAKKGYCPLIKGKCREDCVFLGKCDNPKCQKNHCIINNGLLGLYIIGLLLENTLKNKPTNRKRKILHYIG